MNFKSNATRFLLVPIYIVTILSLFITCNESLAARIGNNYEQQMPVPGVKAPSVRIESLKKIKPGETVDLTAYATVDTKHNGEPFFYWYANQGTFTLHPSYPDYSTVTYTAPNTPGDVTITAQVGDTLGYVGTADSPLKSSVQQTARAIPRFFRTAPIKLAKKTGRTNTTPPTA
jgi:hypothetical protein